MNEMNNIIPFEKSLHIIGFYGPWIVCSITAIQIGNQIPYLISFLFHYVINDRINSILKLWIQEKRPTGSISIQGEKYEGAHAYGMPSGHAQVLFYGLTFYYLVKRSVPWTAGMVFIAGLTLYQRWKYKNHTIRQLVAGSVVGMIVAFIGFFLSKHVLSKHVLTKQVLK